MFMQRHSVFSLNTLTEGRSAQSFDPSSLQLKDCNAIFKKFQAYSSGISDMSCFMNMINYYLLRGQSEFLHVKQKQLPCFVKVHTCAFWLIAGQVTQDNK